MRAGNAKLSSGTPWSYSEIIQQKFRACVPDNVLQSYIGRLEYLHGHFLDLPREMCCVQEHKSGKN